MKRIFAVFAIGLLAMAPGMAFAGWVSLDQAQTVPAAEPVEGAAGTGVVILDEANNELRYWITVTGLSGPISAAHFHGPAAPGESAGVVKTIEFEGNHAAGVWTASDDQPLTAEWIGALKSGMMYVNVHTGLNGPGEIRGQVNIGDNLMAVLDQAQEVPAPNPVEGAAGTGYVLVDEETGEAAYSVTVTGLSGPISAGHFHGPAERGASAGVVRGLTFTNGHASGVWTPADDQPLTDSLLNSLLNGLLYFNVHTELNPPGEIRGQIEPIAQTSGVDHWEILK